MNLASLTDGRSVVHHQDQSSLQPYVVNLPFTTDVVAVQGDTFVTGHFRGYTPDGVVVQVAGDEKSFDASCVYYWSNNYLQPILRDDRAYNRRKDKENHFMVEQVLKLGIHIPDAKLLALDDFPRSNDADVRVPNTTKAWMDAGGDVRNVWVPNPDSRVSSAVTRVGGHGYHGTLLALLSSGTCPVFDVVYLDFCGYFSKNKSSVDALFHTGCLNREKAFVYFTFCKREGRYVSEHVHQHVRDLCDRHGLVCKVVPTDNSSTMWKCAFVVSVFAS